MFGKIRKEEIQNMLESAQKDREAFAEQAQKDRNAMSEQVRALKDDTNALVETMNKDREAFAEQAQKDRNAMSEQVRALKDDTNALVETMNKDREVFAEQAQRDRDKISEQVKALHDGTNALIESVKKIAIVQKKEEKEPAIEKGNELRAAYALNLCTVSVSQIIDYNDLAIMDQEYDNILNNLNLENFPKDEALLKILKQILDVVSFFRIQDGEKKLLEEQYKKKVKDAIWSAVPSPSVILAGGKAGWAGLAVSAISAVGTGYMNYRKERANIDDEKKQKDWELQKTALEQFHALRRELFDTAWRLADAYNFDDSYRLTARQITQYNGILTDEDAQKRYERLHYLEKKFEAYPPHWYNLGHAAADVFHNSSDEETEKKYSKEVGLEYKGYALDAFNKFLELTDDKDKKNNLLREDQLRAACALEKFALISSDESISINDKKELLETAARNSGNAFDTLQLCATSYLELGMNKEAIDLLRMLVNEGYNAEMNAQMLSMLYISTCKTEGQKYKMDHEILSKRGYNEYMFPWPEILLDDAASMRCTYEFCEQQNKFLFNEYKKVISEYITESKSVFDEITQHHGDITEELVEFLNGIKKDIKTLFGDENFAQSTCDNMADSLLKHQNAFSDKKERMKNDEFSFNVMFDATLHQLAERINRQVDEIRKAENDEEKTKKVSFYMNNLLLFKTQKKLLGSSVVNKEDKNEEKTGFDKLNELSNRHQVDQRFKDVIKKYANEKKLFFANDNDLKANFITENFEQAPCVKHKHYIKEHVGFSNVLAYLDTEHSTDILFSTDEVYLFGGGVWRSGIEHTKYASVQLIENKKLKVSYETFKHEQIDMKVLYEMIKELSNLISQASVGDLKFQEMVGDFPEESTADFLDDEEYGLEYCRPF